MSEHVFILMREVEVEPLGGESIELQSVFGSLEGAKGAGLDWKRDTHDGQPINSWTAIDGAGVKWIIERWEVRA